VEIDPVEQRPRHAALVARHVHGVAAASVRPVAGVAARAGVHRGHQDEAGGIADGAARAGQADGPVLERLAKHLEDVSPVLRQLVEEQHPVVREAHLAGAGRRSATHQPGVADRVVRCPERPLDHERAATPQMPGDGVDERRLERLGEGERGKDPGKTAGEHRFAGTWRTHQQEVVRSGRRDLERALRDELSSHVPQRSRPRGTGRARSAAYIDRGRPDDNRPRGGTQTTERRVGGTEHAQPAHHCGLTRVLRRDHERVDARVGAALGHGKHAGDRSQGAVQT
jgi:hypothetical protein